jgi:hypothetical protein
MARIFSIILLSGLLCSFHFIKSTKKPRLTELKKNECVEDCTDPAKIFSTSFNDSTFQVTFGLLLNCCGNDTISYKFRTDTLTIKTKHKPSYTFEKYKGFAYKVEVSTGDCECDCYYIYDATFQGVAKHPRKIIINGQYLGQ